MGLWNFIGDLKFKIRNFSVYIGALNGLDKSAGDVRVAPVLGSPEFRDGQKYNKFGLLANAYEHLAGAEELYNSKIKGYKVNHAIPTDVIALENLPQAQKEYFSAIKWRRNRRAGNFVTCLEATMDEYDRKAWQNAVYHDRGAVIRPGLSEMEMLDTIKAYAEKLKVEDRGGKYKEQLERANKILNKKLLEEIEEDAEIDIEFP